MMFEYKKEMKINLTQLREECQNITQSHLEDESGVVMCPQVFDDWTCWNATNAGQVAVNPCPDFVVGFDPRRYAFKECDANGSWFRHPESNLMWSNYTTCVNMEDLELRNLVNTIYISGYSVSLAALLLSLMIFFYFRSLHCTRIQIHKNLFIALTINSSLWIVWYMEVVEKPNVATENELPCQILHVFVQYFMVATYFWMFCEGLYLHTLLVVAFITENKIMWWLFSVGWGIPALLTTKYALLRYFHEDNTQHCWMEESQYQLILSVPVCLSMIANLVFLINIVRLLLTKLRAGPSSPRSSGHNAGPPGCAGPSNSEKSRKAVRATLILIPLLGLHYMLMPFRPDAESSGEDIYQIVSAVVTSYQGLCVSILFCFLNGEVLSAVRKKWHQYRLNRKRPWQSCSAVTSVSFSRSSFVQEMAVVPRQDGRLSFTGMDSSPNRQSISRKASRNEMF